MSDFAHPRLRELDKQLLVSPADVRVRQADRIEKLVLSLAPDKDYAFEFIYWRVTGFRPTNPPLESYRGDEAAPDLVLMLEHASASAPTPVEACPEPVLTVEQAATRLDVAVRTVHRWRRRGLVGRRYVFPGGRVRTGIRESALKRFVEANRDQVAGSARFSRLTEEEHEEVLREARRLVRQEGLSLTAAARRIARSTGRAVETVRKAVLRTDSDELPAARGRLTSDEKQRVWRAHRSGQSISGLSKRFDRSRASIYRIINDARARRLLESAPSQRPFIAIPEFEQAGADEAFLVDEQQPLPPPAGDGPPLPRPAEEQERIRLLKYNYLKFKADRLRSELDPSRYVPARVLDEIEGCLLAARGAKRRLVAARLPLIVAVARSHAGPVVGLPDLITEGALCLADAVEQFDYRRGDPFEPYARLALMRRFARTIPADNYAGPAPPENADESTALMSLREGLGRIAGELTEEEKQLIREHLALDDDGPDA